MPDVIVIATGDELLHGTTVDTNSAFITSLFFGSNFNVLRHVTVGDDLNSIVECIKKSREDADVLITTGGLGPTDDDRTVEAVCRVLNVIPVIDKESFEKTDKYFKSLNYSFNSLDVKMSTVPENSRVIQNMVGLAPGFIAESKGKIIISLPGVPDELNNMMLFSVLPYLKEKYTFSDSSKLTYRMSGIRESDINKLFNELRLNDFLKFGITSKSGVCDLIITNITGRIDQKENIDLLIKNKFNKFLLDFNAASPEQELVFLLKEKRLTISSAESCTGGLIAKRITDISGASGVYSGSIVAYSNEIKIKLLGVQKETLDVYGAVSEITAAEMVSSAKKIFNTDISVATTGIAGPDGGSEEKPAGTVCFGFQIKDYLHTTTRLFKGNRERVRNFSSLYAINFLRNYIKNNY